MCVCVCVCYILFVPWGDKQGETNIFHTQVGGNVSVSGGGGDCDVDGHELKLKKFKNL